MFGLRGVRIWCSQAPGTIGYDALDMRRGWVQAPRGGERIGWDTPGGQATIGQATRRRGKAPPWTGLPVVSAVGEEHLARSTHHVGEKLQVVSGGARGCGRRAAPGGVRRGLGCGQAAPDDGGGCPPAFLPSAPPAATHAGVADTLVQADLDESDWTDTLSSPALDHPYSRTPLTDPPTVLPARQPYPSHS